MIKLKTHEVCPQHDDCEHRIDLVCGSERVLCKGCDPERDNVFICDFYRTKTIRKIKTSYGRIRKWIYRNWKRWLQNVSYVDYM